MFKRMAAILALDVVGYTAQMSEAPDTTLAALQKILKEIVQPATRQQGGRIVKLMGDGALIEFRTAAGAILAAEQIQRSLLTQEIQMRAGVHAGDITSDGKDIFGEAVNIAARLEASAPPGGAFVSRVAAEVAGSGLSVRMISEGALRLKGLPNPVETLSIDLGRQDRQASAHRMAATQDIRFATSTDGTRIAWTATGDGPLLVKAPNWIQHLEHDWGSALIGWLPRLSERFRLVRSDARCNGLSDRGVADISIDRFVDDLLVMMDTAGVEKAPIFGFSFGSPVAALFAARHPERVSGLILMNGMAQGMHRRARAGDSAHMDSLAALSRNGWDDAYPSIRDLNAQRFSPDASQDDQRHYAEFNKQAINAEDFARIGDCVGTFDISNDLLDIHCPALVLYSNRERIHGPEQSRMMAAGIPNARFVGLDSANNLMPVYDTAWGTAQREIDAFIANL